MKKKSGASVYQAIRAAVQKKSKQSGFEAININQTILNLRKEKKMRSVDLCQKAGDLDPRTLTALEKGRIKNPSIKTLHSVAEGLGVTISDLFRKAEMGQEHFFYHGTQKGFKLMEFPSLGVKAVSFTPLLKDFFCGKLILGSHKRLDETLLKHPQPIFISILIGKVEVIIEDQKIMMKEGENLFFNGLLKHSFYNPLERESVFLIMTAPSFL